MLKDFDSIDELKRSIYLWILPLIIIALITNSFLNTLSNSDMFVNLALLFWFAVSWILALWNRGIRFGEISNLILISVYHVYTLYDVVYHDLAKTGGSLGDFIVWMPLIFMYFFLILGSKKGLFYSAFIIFITLGISLKFIGLMPSESLDSVSQFHAANIVYILVLFYAQNMFRAFTERDIFKSYAYLDSLTGIANRHQIDVWLEEKLKASTEKGKSFSIIFFDIDHFKKINDKYGHKIGDCILKEIAAVVSVQNADGEMFGRWGGEEFMLIADGSSQHGMEKALSLRRVIESHKFKEVGHLTASFGVTQFRPGDNIDSMLNRADEGLYLSKNNGRNRVSEK